jgi:voltage-gated potassium channel
MRFSRTVTAARRGIVVFLRARLTPRSLRFILPAAGVLVLIAGGGFAALETDTVTSYWDGAWWALALMTTVGFPAGGPSTVAGKALAALLLLGGFLVIAMTTAAIASLFVREQEEPSEERSRTFEREVLDELRELSRRLERLERE